MSRKSAPTPFDVAGVRAQFPVLARKIGDAPLHYLDNAATAQMPESVLEAVQTHDAQHRANVMRSVHTLAEEATEAYEQARRTVAAYVGAKSPEELIFTSGTTGGINLIAHSFGEGLGEGDEVVISQVEHHSNLVPWQLLAKRRGVVLKYLPATDEGRVDTAALAKIVTAKCRLIAVTHTSNVTGAVTDIGLVVAAARAVGALVLLDGAQRAPHGPMDVQAMDIDFFAFSGHKMFGPSGVGALWARREVLEDLPPFLGGGEMIRSVSMEGSSFADPPHRFEAGTPPITQAVGMAAAANWISGLDVAASEAHQMALTDRLLSGIGDLAGKASLRIIGPSGLQNRAPVVSFAAEGLHPHDISQILDSHGVAVRGGHHCAQPLMESFGLTGTTRASLAPYNDHSDVDAFLNGLEDALDRLPVVRGRG